MTEGEGPLLSRKDHSPNGQNPDLTLNGMSLQKSCPQIGKKMGEGNQSSPGTWPLGVQLPTSHPPGCPCQKRQELLKREELKDNKRAQK